MSGPDERGSVLMLMPAAVLVLVVLGAIAVDAALVFMAQRELQNATAAAANDAAVAALSEQALYECGDLTIAGQRARAVVEAAFAARIADTVETVGRPEVTVAADGALQVTVAARGTVELLFTPAVRDWDTQEVTASTTSSPELAPGGPALPPTGCDENDGGR